MSDNAGLTASSSPKSIVSIRNDSKDCFLDFDEEIPPSNYAPSDDFDCQIALRSSSSTSVNEDVSNQPAALDTHRR